MHVQALGHVVLKVRDLHRSEDFYSGLLGMRIISRISDPPMTFFTSGHRGTITTSPSWSSVRSALWPDDDATGLAHVAFKVG